MNLGYFFKNRKTLALRVTCLDEERLRALAKTPFLGKLRLLLADAGSSEM